MAITAKDALQEAKDAMDLAWVGNNDRDALILVVEQLVADLPSPEHALQLVQALWLPSDTKPKNKPVAKRILDKLADALPVYADGDHALAWVQNLAWSALRVGLESDPRGQTALLIALMRSGAEWCVPQGRVEHLWRRLFKQAELARRMPQTPKYNRYEAFSGWPNAEFDFDADKPYLDVQKSLENWGNAPQNIVNAVTQLNRAASSEIETIRVFAEKVIQHIEKHLAQPLAAPSHVTEPLETLWWGQSLYSPLLHESYRDLNTSEKLFWMAEDMAQLPNTFPSEARTAFFAETLRRVLTDDIDKPTALKNLARELYRGVRDGLAREPEANVVIVPPRFRDAFEKDPTGLPITFIVEGALRKTNVEEIIAELPSKVGLSVDLEKSTRQWGRWVCRERLLVRFLDTLV